MKTLILNHGDCLRHDPGKRHAERADRVRAVLGAVGDLPGTELLPAPKASLEQIVRVHPEAYWDFILDLEPGRGEGQIALDPDTFLSPGSVDATLRGSGGACFAVDQVVAGDARNAFCVTRPPGHHAESSRAMGFCLLNHVAVAAAHARAEHGIDRVAILDFDVHHGNGTQAIFENEANVLFVSSHQVPLYPGTGYPEETGCGNILNLPMSPGSGSTEFRAAWSHMGLPRLTEFRPELIIVSAGFDAHELDPLAQMELQDDDYGWITTRIMEVAAEICDGRIVSNLEGGYDLEALAGSAAAHVTALTA